MTTVLQLAVGLRMGARPFGATRGGAGAVVRAAACVHPQLHRLCTRRPAPVCSPPVAQRKVGGGGHGLEVRLALRGADRHVRQLRVDGPLPRLCHAPAVRAQAGASGGGGGGGGHMPLGSQTAKPSAALCWVKHACPPDAASACDPDSGVSPRQGQHTPGGTGGAASATHRWHCSSASWQT